MITDAAGADAAMNGAPNEVAEAVTETATDWTFKFISPKIYSIL